MSQPNLRSSPTPPAEVMSMPPPQYSFGASRNSRSAPHPYLHITVPNQTEPLGCAIKLAKSLLQDLPEFNTITQLPTPLLLSAPFASLEVRKNKRAAKGETKRIVSAFDPNPRPDPRGPPSSDAPARNISNPLVFPDVKRHSPLPPVSPGLIHNQLLKAPRLGASFVTECVVGSGSFSTVMSARDIESDHVVAVKIVSYPIEEHTTVSDFRAFIVRELGILTHLSHPCLVKLLDYDVSLDITLAEIHQSFLHEEAAAPMGQSWDIDDPLLLQQYFYLEYCPGGNLYNWLKTHHRLFRHSVHFWLLMARIVAELLTVVAYLHSQRVIHRDIKLENILLNDVYDPLLPPSLDNTSVCTLTDFGLSKRLLLDSQLLTTKCGSQDYVSPELLLGLKYDGKLLDAWAIGVLVYSIVENRLPFDSPPLEYVQSAGISPTVIKRRMSKRTPAHRIAMIDWDWYSGPVTVKDDIDGESEEIIQNLMALVGVLLVRKEKRMLVDEVLADSRFSWVAELVPKDFVKS